MKKKKPEIPVSTKTFAVLLVTDFLPSGSPLERPEYGSMDMEWERVRDEVMGQLYGMETELPALVRTEDGNFHSMKVELVVKKADPAFACEAIKQAIARLGRVEDLDAAREARRQVLVGYLHEVGGRKPRGRKAPKGRRPAGGSTEGTTPGESPDRDDGSPPPRALGAGA